jgi:hypothetical protein
MNEFPLARCADALRRIFVEHILTNGRFATDAQAERALFKPVERVAEFFDVCVASKCKQRIYFAEREVSAGKAFSGINDRILILQAIKQPGEDQSSHYSLAPVHCRLLVFQFLLEDPPKSSTRQCRAE